MGKSIKIVNKELSPLQMGETAVILNLVTLSSIVIILSHPNEFNIVSLYKPLSVYIVPFETK